MTILIAIEQFVRISRQFVSYKLKSNEILATRLARYVPQEQARGIYICQ